MRLALKSWGNDARYAGSKDRAWVSGLVLDALRRRRSIAWKMGDDSVRAAILGVLKYEWDWPVDRIAAAVTEEPHGHGALTDVETAALETPHDLADAPPSVRGDYPQWLEASFARAFGDAAAREGEALSERAPIDLRVNTLKTDPARALKATQPLNAAAVPELPNALRIPAPAATDRAGAVETIPAFSKGWFEVQDLGSQIAAACAGEVKGAQVLDLCAGGGGKTLALAAAMGNTGQIYAYDSEARRLADTIRRADRAGVRNLQIRSPVTEGPLVGLEAKMDVVFIDAPCSGSGAWRRHPDTKWRLSEETFARRQSDQDAVLDLGATFVKPGGRLIYVTCSVLPEEDEDRVAAFLARTEGFAVKPATSDEHLTARLTPEGYLRLTPATAATDGFFVAVLERTQPLADKAP